MPLHRSFHELKFIAAIPDINPYLDLQFEISFTRSNGRVSTAEGFYDGDNTFRVRAYCDTMGKWQWNSSSNITELDKQKGNFTVEPSDHRGKLRIHHDDPYQFQYDNGKWFLHIGDTGYRYLARSEHNWKKYIDQASLMGATKIRTWFCEGRSDVQVLLAEDRQSLNLSYWQEMDKRIAYAQIAYPHIILQLIPYGEDTEEIRKYDSGDSVSLLIGQYAQARFTGYPNVTWCLSNDRKIVKDGELKETKIYWKTINQMAKDFASREPWNTLITNHQCRFTGYDFIDCAWSDIVTLEDLDQADGKLLLHYREKISCPIVIDEDRYEKFRPPLHPRYFFRRLMWSNILSGGHATYGGLLTFEPGNKEVQGVHGYYDACKDGRLKKGAHDFNYIHQFFNDSGLTMTGMNPDDACVGNEPLKWKCARTDTAWIIYLANPDGSSPETDNLSQKIPSVKISLPAPYCEGRWYTPSSGLWSDQLKLDTRKPVKALGSGDQILLITTV